MTAANAMADPGLSYRRVALGSLLAMSSHMFAGGPAHVEAVIRCAR